MAPGRRQLKRLNDIGQGRYLTCSCYQRLPLLGNPAIRDAFVSHLCQVHAAGGFSLFAWVVMPEHFHLLMLPDRGEVTSILRGLKAPFAQRVLRRWDELNARILPRLRDARGDARFWQRGGGYDRNTTSDHELTEKSDYIHANPVRRGLVDSPGEWRWSSARQYAGLDGIGPALASAFQ